MRARFALIMLMGCVSLPGAQVARADGFNLKQVDSSKPLPQTPAPTPAKPQSCEGNECQQYVLRQLRPCWEPIIMRGKPEKTTNATFGLDMAQNLTTGKTEIAPRTVDSLDKMPPVYTIATLDRKGNVTKVALTDESAQNAEKLINFRRITQEVMKGAMQCGHFPDLPANEYDHWRMFPLVFDLNPPFVP